MRTSHCIQTRPYMLRALILAEPILVNTDIDELSVCTRFVCGLYS